MGDVLLTPCSTFSCGREGERRIRQLTTSAIANKQTRPHQALAASLMQTASLNEWEFR